ncbi:MAG: hypothetical protein NWR72_04910 [Bacteroidia bacterium]|nr:hypothetical protein [Bacteroidia bacterium]
MKPLFTAIACLLSLSANGQLHIGSGTHLVVQGQPGIVLHNTSWDNDGTFSADSSRVVFRGAQTDSVSGTSETLFFQLSVEKASDSLRLAQAIQVEDSLFFVSGTLALEGRNLTLGTDHGVLVGESETSRITGANGGEVVKVAILNAPSSENPGNLGMTITSAAIPGPTVIRRGHQLKSLPNGTSIQRYYDISPATNTGLNATIVFSYFDAELNGQTETNLESWHQTGTNWINREPDATYDLANTVEVTLDTLGMATLAEGALKVQPVVFLQGAFSGTQMTDGLRSAGVIPTTEPYSALGFPQQGGGGETIEASVLATTGNDAIVDWLFLELRSAADSSVIVRTQSALLQADGDVVGLDGISAVTFAGVPIDDYFLTVKHRNHLGVRTPSPITLSRIATSYDFSSSLNQAWDKPGIINDAMVDVSGTGIYGLFTGDVTGDQFINATDFQATSNLVTPNQSAVYQVGDINLDANLNATDFQTSNNVSTPNKIGHVHP